MFYGSSSYTIIYELPLFLTIKSLIPACFRVKTLIHQIFSSPPLIIGMLQFLDTDGAQMTSPYSAGTARLRCPWQTPATKEQNPSAEPDFRLHTRCQAATAKYLHIESSTFLLFHHLLTALGMPNTVSCSGDRKMKKIKLLPSKKAQSHGESQQVQK